MLKERASEIYFVRSIGTQKTADFTPLLPSTIGAEAKASLPSP
jgi:hypothetical protein